MDFRDQKYLIMDEHLSHELRLAAGYGRWKIRAGEPKRRSTG